MTLLTEQEAAEKWCPLARAISGEIVDGQLSMRKGSVPANVIFVSNKSKLVERHDLSMCIGSKCMAWRQSHKMDLRYPPGDDRRGERNGYCGAFGKVQS